MITVLNDTNLEADSMPVRQASAYKLVALEAIDVFILFVTYLCNELILNETEVEPILI